MPDNQPPNYSPDIQLKLISRKMVHSLNNMLFVINGYAEFIRETHMDKETLQNIKQIEIAAEQCQKITRDWRAEADILVPDPENDESTL